jgi:serine/threonine protein kinase/tetratricopeptide (TPR) repeat protein
MSMTEVRGQDSTPAFTDPIAPLRIALRGHYEIERQIGQGAYATVYLARDLKHERKVAIKVLTADPESETGEIRFIREIRLVARLQHPNILPLHDSGHVEALLYYVMPYVDGETLRVRMHRERQMGIEAACSIARETADALAYAHKQGIVHRDIKPENILLSGGHAIVADFGIARAIDVAGVKQLTVTGVAGPGTPAYMSPEQLLGDRGVDARSDIYSLGCVLYEMLAAKAPFLGKDGFVKRFTEPPPRISSLRRDSPPWIDEIIAKALAKNPADRFATATDFVGALCQPTATVRTPRRPTPIKHALASPPLFDTDPLEEQEMGAAFPDSYPSGGVMRKRSTDVSIPQRWLRVVRGNPRRSALSMLALLVGAGALGAAWRNDSFPSLFGGVPPTDSTRFVILASAASGGPMMAVNAQIADSLYDAFTKWEGAPVVSETRVRQEISDGAPGPPTGAAARAAARRVGAGRVVLVQASGTSQSPRLRITLYDTESGEALDEFGVPTEHRTDAFYASSVQRLLGFSNRPAAAVGCDGRTRTFRAWMECNRGHIAMAKWDLSGATRAFVEAVNTDPGYAPARLWLAQLLMWTAPDSADWRTHANRAARGVSDLSSRDSALAIAVAALASNNYPLACDTYATLKDREPRSFVGWFGLGECLRLDHIVVPDTRSKSGWSFRSGLHTARKMYERALELEPNAHTLLSYVEVSELLPTSASSSRRGYAADSSTFPAFPSLANDTLVFVPYPLAEFAALPAGSNLTHNAALERNSDLLLAFTREWTRQFPVSPDAYEALADILEARGEVAGPMSSDNSALAAVHRALGLAKSDGHRLRLAIREVRLRVKRLEFARASAIADSLLTNRMRGGRDSEDLIGVAAMMGRIRQTAQLAREAGWMPAVTSVRIATPLLGSAADLFAHAVVGACGATASDLVRDMERQIQSYVPESQRTEVRRALSRRALSMLVPCTNGESALLIDVPMDRLQRMQRAFARKDFRTVRIMIDTLSTIRRYSRPGDLTLDYTYQEAWLKAAIGDTTAAIAQLDRALQALPSLSGGSLMEPGPAAAIGRAMTLRADLAIAKHDLPTARKWGSAVAALWNKSDPELQPTVSRMRQIVAPH